MILYIVRHGNTFDAGDVVTRVGGKTDIPLSTSGELQANNLAQAFENIDIDRCYTSPLRRTMQTAETICTKMGVVIKPAEFLREIDYGPDENIPENVVIERIGIQAIRNWDEKSLVPQGWNVDPKVYIHAWADFCENLQGGTTLVVTSNGVARFLLDALKFDGNTPALTNRKLKTGSVGKFVKEGNHWSLKYWGERPPLP